MAVPPPEDEPACHQCVSRIPQYAIVLLATLANFSIGSSFAWISPVSEIYNSPPQRKSITLSKQDISWLSSLVPLGAALGSLPAEIIADKIGRKRCIKIISPFLVLCWLITGFVDDKLWMLLARTVIGIVCGAYSIIIPIYLREIVDRRLGESLSTVCQIQLYLGILFAYFTACSMDCLTIALLCAIPPTVLSVASVVMPESPVWLTTKNRHEEADAVMRCLRRTLTPMETTTTSIQQIGCMSVFKGHTKATIIAFTLVSLLQMSGMPVLISYSSSILYHIYPGVNPLFFSIVAGFMPVIAACLHPYVLKRINAKLLLFLSLCTMAVCLFILSGYFRLMKSYYVYDLSWIPFLSMAFFMGAFVIGCEPVSWILIDKIFTSDVKRMAITGSVACNWICSFMATKAFQDMTSLMGYSTVFAIYGISTLMGTAFVARMIPETEGKSEEELQTELHGRNLEGSDIPTCC